MGENAIVKTCRQEFTVTAVQARTHPAVALFKHALSIGYLCVELLRKAGKAARVRIGLHTG